MSEEKSIIIYCDSNIYLDYFGSRKDRFRDLGEFAFQIFRRTLDCEFKLVLSDWLLYELKNHMHMDKLKDFLEEFKKKNKIIKIYKTDEDIAKAKQLANHFQDVLHQLLAKKANAKYLITRNIQDYIMMEGLEVKFPENI
jgi:predicted nucleic acid-binding protein